MVFTTTQVISLLLFLLEVVLSIDPRTKDPNYHVATSTQMTIKKDDGTIVFGSDTGDNYRVEARSSNGEVRGVYGYQLPDGSYKTVGYSAGVEGYKTLPIDKISPFGLTPFPFDMGGENDKELQPISALADLAKSYKQPKVTDNKIFDTAIENMNNLYPSEESLIQRGNRIWKSFMKKSTKASDHTEPTNKDILSILNKLQKLEDRYKEVEKL